MPRGMRIFRNAPARWCVFILLGAVVNIGVAWTCGRFGAFTYDQQLRGETTLQHSSDTHTHLWMMRAHTFGVRVLKVSKARPSEERVLGDMQPLERVWPWWIEYDDLRIAHSRHDPTDGVSAQGVIMTEAVAQGWPLPALWCERFEHREMLGGRFLSLAKVEDSFVAVPRVLAFRPLWLGFALNTMFYAALLWVVIAFPFALRRRLRIRRGLCPACAYPVGSSQVCTECGRPVQPSSAKSVASQG
jgi:hypothetical protein